MLFVTSPGPGEGKSTTAGELARNIAQLGNRVLLIDSDLRDPSQHRSLRLPNSIGLSTLLSGAAEPGQAIQRAGDLGFDAITSGPLPPSPPELLAGERLPGLLKALTTHYDTVIIDGPPVAGLADAPLIGHHAEATVLVAATGKTHRNALARSLARLRSTNTHVLGTMLTLHTSRRGDDGYGYYYYRYGADAA